MDKKDVDELARRLSTADVSVLMLGIADIDSKLMTTGGSANDIFWSALRDLGLTDELAVPDDVAKELEDAGLTLKLYAVTPRGQAEIPALMERARKK